MHVLVQIRAVHFIWCNKFVQENLRKEACQTSMFFVQVDEYIQVSWACVRGIRDLCETTWILAAKMGYIIYVYNCMNIKVEWNIQQLEMQSL